jgi:hypothetical protein
MSTTWKVKIRSVQKTGQASGRARVSSSSCSCKKGHSSGGNTSSGHKSSGSKSTGNKSTGHKSCGHQTDPAVLAMQEAGGDLSKLFKQLKDEAVSEMLVKAIRQRNAKAIQCLLGCHCKVLAFFCCHNKDCVRICCSFGRNHEVTISFDICVKKAENPCGRCWY